MTDYTRSRSFHEPCGGSMLERCSSCILPHNFVKADVEFHSDFESDLGSALVGEISFAWLETAAVGL